MPKHCKEIGVRVVDCPLTPRDIVGRLLHTKAYKKTGYIILNNGGKWAIAAITKKPHGRGLFREITGVRILSLPKNTRCIKKPKIDVLNRTAMASISEKNGKVFVIVRGKYEHVSFVSDEKTRALNVIDIVPPRPPHLADLARTAVECGMVNAPVEIALTLLDLNSLGGKTKTKYAMFPCGCSALARKNSFFLDRCPPLPQDVLKDITLIGCERSARIFSELYKLKPKRISTCPLDYADIAGAGALTITRCCELKRKMRISGKLAVVPWDASLAQVARAINELVKRN